MKVYFCGGRQVPDGFKRIILVTDQHRRPFNEATISRLSKKFQCAICFPAPDPHNFLLLCRENSSPTMRAIRKSLDHQAVMCRLYNGGIFNPYLPVRPYDAWFD